MEPQEVLQLTFAGLTNGSIYAIVALSFTIVFNATGVANFAQGEFVMLGGLVTVSLISLGLPSRWQRSAPSRSWPQWPG